MATKETTLKSMVQLQNLNLDPNQDGITHHKDTVSAPTAHWGRGGESSPSLPDVPEKLSSH